MAKPKKRKRRRTWLIFKSMAVGTTKPATFIKELDKLCKKFSNGHDNHMFAWESEEE